MVRWRFIGYIIFLTCTAFTCGEYIVVPREVKDFTLTHIDNSGEALVEVDSGQTIPARAYVLKLSLDFERGWDDDDDYNTELIDPIQSVQIIALYPLNEQYSSESEVTDCFKGFQLDERVDSLKYKSIELSDLITVCNPFLYLALMEEAQKGKQQFQVKLTLVSGKILSHKTSPILFLR